MNSLSSVSQLSGTGSERGERRSALGPNCLLISLGACWLLSWFKSSLPVQCSDASISLFDFVRVVAAGECDVSTVCVPVCSGVVAMASATGSSFLLSSSISTVMLTLLFFGKSVISSFAFLGCPWESKLSLVWVSDCSEELAFHER